MTDKARAAMVSASVEIEKLTAWIDWRHPGELPIHLAESAGVAVDKLREALAEPRREAVAVCETGMPGRRMHKWFKKVPQGTILYAEAPHSSASAST